MGNGNERKSAMWLLVWYEFGLAMITKLLPKAREHDDSQNTQKYEKYGNDR